MKFSDGGGVCGRAGVLGPEAVRQVQGEGWETGKRKPECDLGWLGRWKCPEEDNESSVGPK